MELSVRTHSIDLDKGEGLEDRPGSTISVPALRKDNGVEELVAGRVFKRGLSLTSLRGGSPSEDCGDFLFLPVMALRLQASAKNHVNKPSAKIVCCMIFYLCYLTNEH